MGLVMFYYLYLLLLRYQIDIFNCNPTIPDGGNTYVGFVDISCGGLCKCWDFSPDGWGLQAQLLFPAICCFLIYSVGFPVLLFTVLFRKRKIIKEDQVMRSIGLVTKDGKKITRVDLGEECYETRARYSRVYYHFKPSYYYWILVIILRKFGIAFISLFFKACPSQQLSICLMLLFGCYVIQVANRPYMSPSEYDRVMEEEKRKASKSGSSTHAKIVKMITKRQTAQARSKRKSTVR